MFNESYIIYKCDVENGIFLQNYVNDVAIKTFTSNGLGQCMGVIAIFIVYIGFNPGLILYLRETCESSYYDSFRAAIIYDLIIMAVWLAN